MSYTRTLLERLMAPTAAIGHTETQLLQHFFPMGDLAVGDEFELDLAGTKSGKTDMLTLPFRVGVNGNSSDANVWVVQVPWLIPATALEGGGKHVFKIVDATHIAHVGFVGNGGAFTGASANPPNTPVAIPDITANDLYVTLSALSSGTTDTVAVQVARMDLVTG